VSTDRRLAAIWFSDIVGYTALMGKDEQAGLRVRERHRTLLRPLAARHHGKIVDENGDELVAVFPSALDAVACALSAQTSLCEDPELRLRIGIHLGDVIFEGGRVYGDGVNVASRIRPLAEAGGIAVSEPVFDAVRTTPESRRRRSARPSSRTSRVRWWCMRSPGAPLRRQRRVASVCGGPRSGRFSSSRWPLRSRSRGAGNLPRPPDRHRSQCFRSPT
jgi:class 3 adenylate cyclase